MNFELGKQYIVDVTDKGIIPIDEFDNERFFDKDNDDLEFLTDEEKTVVINKVLNDIKAEFINLYPTNQFSLNNVLKLINKYRGD